MNIPIPEFSLTFVLFSIFALAFIVQLIYYWLVFSKLAFYRPKKRSKKPAPVSVVICARNEYHLLKKNLSKILEQEYPDFEVVVVNDASTDETMELLKDFERKYSNISIVNITQNLNFFSGKKFPLALGIKSAKNELLLLTDADCEPASPLWLENMASAFTSKTEIVLGYSPIKQSKGFLNTLMRYNTMQMAMQYLSYALMGKTFMGVGRNLAYRKSMFYRSKGFISQYKLQSGEDDLFINRVATKKNTRIQVCPESFMYTDGKPNFSLWFRMKKQNINTSGYYKRGTKFLRGNYSLSQFLFYALFVALLVWGYNSLFVLTLFAFRLLTQLIIIKKCMFVLSERKLLLISPLLEILLMLVHISVRISNIFIKQNKWK